MIEGLAAISLAGNIIQFISFSSVLLSRSREIYHSASGSSAENVDLETISENIKDLSTQIHSNANVSDRFRNIAVRCESVAKELLDAISKLQCKARAQGSQNGPTKWQSFRKSLRSLWEKERIEELRSRLDQLRDQVTMNLVSRTSDNQIELLRSLEDWRSENVQASYQITEQIRAVQISLNDAHRQLSHIHNDDYWNKLQRCFSQISSKVQQVSQSHTIIESLGYECMEVRHERIKDAHVRTFDWIFNPENFGSQDNRSRIGFSQWLQNGDGIYWITGKPGSGKSTLMKYLFDHNNTTRQLRVWSKNIPLVKASFYFWNPGEEMQKSLQGLLQSLLYHVLDACPDLIPVLCYKRWTGQQPQYMSSKASWTLTELKAAFTLLKEQSSVAVNFYFHIDGLDEYHGDHWEVIKILEDLSTSPNVKLCLSSRPWNCFKDAFGRSGPNMLQLHELTREDIELFARENLISYSRYTEVDPKLFDNLIQDIGDRAQGVFLWVRLVVRSLRDGIINEDPVAILHERLRMIPSDLEKFFEHILESVDDVYRTRMASTFIAALTTTSPLNMIHYYFLEQDDTTHDLDSPWALWKEPQIQRCVIKTQRRLNGRFKGLLEPSSTINITSRTGVDFLHRTLRDFLATDRMMRLLETWATGDLNVYKAISFALIAELKFIRMYPHRKNMENALHWATQGAIEKGDVDHFFAILDQIELICERVIPKRPGYSRKWLMVQIAAAIGQIDYLRYRLQKDGVTLDLDHILKYAMQWSLTPGDTFASSFGAALDCFNVSSDYIIINTLSSPSTIAFLLSHGANPHAMVDGGSSWDTFLSKLIVSMDDARQERCWDLLEVFLRHGVDFKITTSRWSLMLLREGSTRERALRNTLRCFKRLFKSGLNPNIETQNSTLTMDFLHTLSNWDIDNYSTARSIQNNLLREFFRCGADVSQVYKDVSERGWLTSFLRRLAQYMLGALETAQITQFRIFLEHGLDPNTYLFDGATIWEHLLKAILSGLLQDSNVSLDKSNHQIIHNLLLLGLEFGANPHALQLQDIFDWMRSRKCQLVPAQVLELERAFQKEIEQRTTQPHFRPSPNAHLNKRWDGALARCNGNIAPNARKEVRQGQKRNAAHLPHSRPASRRRKRPT